MRGISRLAAGWRPVSFSRRIVLHGFSWFFSSSFIWTKLSVKVEAVLTPKKTNYTVYDSAWMAMFFVFINSLSKIVLTKKSYIQKWQRSFTRKPRKANTLHVYNLRTSLRQKRLLVREYFIGHFVYFPWPPLEAGLSISTFCFLFTRCLSSVCLRRNYTASNVIMYTFYCLITLRCCNFCWLYLLLFLRPIFRTGATNTIKKN